jgi:hypothetical protein
MKIGITLLCALLIGTGIRLHAQVQPVIADSSTKPAWEFNAVAIANFLPGDFFMLPMVMASKNHLHLEARYNYEDRKTVSLWGGYSFWGGENFTWNLIPMSGIVLGNTNGVAPGLKATLGYKRFQFYTEGEWLISFEDINNNFIYFWSDLTYSPLDWLTIGYSGQKTRVYRTQRDVQNGILVGFNYKKVILNTYFYNIGASDSFVLLVAAAIRF